MRLTEVFIVELLELPLLLRGGVTHSPNPRLENLLLLVWRLLIEQLGIDGRVDGLHLLAEGQLLLGLRLTEVLVIELLHGSLGIPLVVGQCFLKVLFELVAAPGVAYVIPGLHQVGMEARMELLDLVPEALGGVVLGLLWLLGRRLSSLGITGQLLVVLVGQVLEQLGVVLLPQ